MCISHGDQQAENCIFQSFNMTVIGHPPQIGDQMYGGMTED